ncbi:MAG: transcriptional regulator [Streptosporangiales bacterium]|nr:transcriptional regulator [Streptosporangiales bacterium]
MDSAYCPHFHWAVELIGRRWSGAIMIVLSGGAQRFGEIRAAIPGLSDRLLVERLRELEAEGVVVRAERPHAGGAPLVTYALTAEGLELVPVLEAIGEWAHRRMTRSQRSARV